MVTHEFTDEWGEHRHKIEGPPYNPKTPITCASCINMLESRMAVWLETLTERHKLPQNFWDSHTFSWR